MYKIEFYENQHGESEVWDFLEALRVKSQSSKDARIQYNQIIFYIDLLAKTAPICRSISPNIWKKTSGNCVQEIIGSFIFTMTRASMYCSIISAKNHRKHRNGKSPVPKQNATITSVRRRQNNENLGRL